MSILETCEFCKGYGHILCRKCNGKGVYLCKSCLCKTCSGTGTVECEHERCCEGYNTCQVCKGFGHTSIKVLGFIPWYLKCDTCEGKKKILCVDCGGSFNSPCNFCKGNGRDVSCSHCNGAGEIVCIDCKGEGKNKCKGCGGHGRFLSKSAEALTQLPLDKLRFEFEKRQRKIQQSQIKLSRLSQEQHEEYIERQRLRESNPGAFRHASWDDLHSQEISSLESEISSLEEELNYIEHVIDNK